MVNSSKIYMKFRYFFNVGMTMNFKISCNRRNWPLNLKNATRKKHRSRAYLVDSWASKLQKSLLERCSCHNWPIQTLLGRGVTYSHSLCWSNTSHQWHAIGPSGHYDQRLQCSGLNVTLVGRIIIKLINIIIIK